MYTQSIGYTDVLVFCFFKEEGNKSPDSGISSQSSLITPVKSPFPARKTGK